ncbi:MAG: Asp23/Gls24 family envelope stress response protein, partial [Elusimicrobiota bacterium]
DSIIINLFLIINYGIRIPDLTWEIQARVKELLKDVTYLDVDKINVHIQGINYPKKYRYETQLVTQEMFVKIF